MPETIEADVLEIDGSPPPALREPEREPAWQGLKARVLRLDRRWWPFWVVLGLAAFALLAVAGVFFTVFLIAVRLLGSILRFFTRNGPARADTGLSKSVH